MRSVQRPISHRPSGMTLVAPAAADYCRPPFAWLPLGEPPPDPLSEADLSTIWAGQRYPPGALTAADGRPLRVLNPGRLNNGPGPDFRDAILELDGQQRRGDVELHVRASYFQGHGHHLDLAYAGLALHVVYLADAGADTVLAGGGRAPVAAFAPWLTGRVEELQSWLAAPPLWQEPCRGAAGRLGDAAVNAALREAGLRRFQARAARITALVKAEGAEQALWASLLDALGVGGDRDGFRRLAGVFPVTMARPLAEGDQPASALPLLEAALLATAGLGQAPAELAGRLPPPLRPAITRTGRPMNWPERRLAALARLYVRAGGELAPYAVECVRRARDAKGLLAGWQVLGADGRGPALLGRERAQELLVNVVLPFAAIHEALAEPAEALLAQLPAASAYGRTAFLEANLQRADGKRRVRGVLEQQGLIGMLEEWCSQGGCGRCPLS